MTLYNKPPLSPADQIAHLRGKGMLITDVVAAYAVLKRVGFYRFKGFALEYQNLANPGKPYAPGTTLEQVNRVIQLDDLLRMHVMAGLQIVEVGLRQHIAEELTRSHGIRWYTEAALFRPPRPNTRDFDHSTFLLKTREEFNQSHEPFVTHYANRYSRAYPPSWMIAEVLTFGTWSKLYGALQTPYQQRISQPLGLHQVTLREWLKALNIVRNVAAHHARLWNRPFRTMPIADQRPPTLASALRTHSFDFNDPQALRLAPRLYALHRLTQAVYPGCTWTTDLKTLLANYTPAELPRLGLRPAWDHQPEWA